MIIFNVNMCVRADARALVFFGCANAVRCKLNHIIIIHYLKNQFKISYESFAASSLRIDWHENSVRILSEKRSAHKIALRLIAMEHKLEKWHEH